MRLFGFWIFVGVGEGEGCGEGMGFLCALDLVTTSEVPDPNCGEEVCEVRFLMKEFGVGLLMLVLV